MNPSSLPHAAEYPSASDTSTTATTHGQYTTPQQPNSYTHQDNLYQQEHEAQRRLRGFAPTSSSSRANFDRYYTFTQQHPINGETVSMVEFESPAASSTGVISNTTMKQSMTLVYGLFLILAIGVAVWGVTLVIKNGQKGLINMDGCPADTLFKMLIAKCALWCGIVTLLLMSFAISIEKTAPTLTVCTQCLYIADTVLLLVMTIFLGKNQCVSY